QRTLPQSLVGKAITYVRNQKEYLSSFLKDGRIQLSNNLAEQSVKPFVIGRKNWLFANTPNGASASSLIYSVIQTAIANDLKPLSYLEYVFEQIQMSWDLQTEDLLPWSEKIPECCKNQKPSSSQ
ncbi:IS66 family transposase, partial [[Clostridium] polysaccharolyticum]